MRYLLYHLPRLVGSWVSSRRLLCGVLAVACLALGCSPIKSSYLRSDYDKVDRLQVKRLKVTIAPPPGARKDLGQLWLEIATNHINQKKNFLIKASAVLAQQGDLKSHCTKGIEGWLQFTPTVTQQGGQVAAGVAAVMWRCRDGQKIWSTTASGVWPSEDAQLKALTENYVKTIGAGVQAFVAPCARLLFTVIENLPNPKLNDDDINEKIQMGS